MVDVHPRSAPMVRPELVRSVLGDMGYFNVSDDIVQSILLTSQQQLSMMCTAGEPSAKDKTPELHPQEEPGRVPDNLTDRYFSGAESDDTKDGDSRGFPLHPAEKELHDPRSAAEAVLAWEQEHAQPQPLAYPNAFGNVHNQSTSFETDEPPHAVATETRAAPPHRPRGTIPSSSARVRHTAPASSHPHPHHHSSHHQPTYQAAQTAPSRRPTSLQPSVSGASWSTNFGSSTPPRRAASNTKPLCPSPIRKRVESQEPHGVIYRSSTFGENHRQRHSDPVKLFHAMDKEWKKDPFLTQQTKGRPALRWKFRVAMLMGN